MEAADRQAEGQVGQADRRRSRGRRRQPRVSDRPDPGTLRNRARRSREAVEGIRSRALTRRSSHPAAMRPASRPRGGPRHGQISDRMAARRTARRAGAVLSGHAPVLTIAASIQCKRAGGCHQPPARSSACVALTSPRSPSS
ncbi:hypothetical protein BDI4_380005 [Burkholderia diffusa]|nr:hypothetical protein BDI4_380005 [Burkholderia diffusa]